MADQRVTWDDAVARVDATDHRPAARIALDVPFGAGVAAVTFASGDRLARRRIAARNLRSALAAYRLAGGDPEHFDRLIDAESAPLIDDVAGSVGDRARVARAALAVIRDHATRTDLTLEQRNAVLAYLDDHAAALERPGLDAAAVNAARALADYVIPNPGAVGELNIVTLSDA